METASKVFMGIIGVALLTTLILPHRQTPAVIGAVGKAFSGSLYTAMGSGR